jgi:hypothetical protein
MTVNAFYQALAHPPLATTRSDDMLSRMGVTIHFEGQLNNEAAYQELVGVASSMADAEGWQIETIASGDVTLPRVRDEKDWNYTGPVKGIVIYVHEDCDPVRLEFDRDLYVQEFTKTQFAGVQIHLKVLKLLKAIEPFFRNLTVEDDGEWWETQDTANLEEHMARVQQVIDEELRKAPSTQVKVKTPSGRIMDFLT